MAAVLQRALEKCSMFDCACCGLRKRVSEVGRVHVYRPLDRSLAAMAKPAVYVLCSACEGLDEGIREPMVFKTLSRNGTFS